MTPKPSTTNKEFIEYRFGEIDKKLDRIEKKMDSYTYAKQGDVDALDAVAKDVEKRLNTVEQKIKPIEKIYYLVLGTFTTGIIGLAFFLLQKALSK